MRVMGVDPGASGALALVSHTWAEATIMPMLDKRIDVDAFVKILEAYDPALVMIERPQMMGTGSQQTALSSGINYGIMIGVFRMMLIPFQEVAPVTWKSKMGLGDPAKARRSRGPKEVDGRTPKEIAADRTARQKVLKDRSIRLASNLFPKVDLRASQRCKVQHDGKAEALLLAAYGLRLLGSK